MIFFEVPTAAALAEAEENKDKVIRKPNRVHVQTHTSEKTLGTTASTVKEFPVIHVQAGKTVYVSLEVPLRHEVVGGICINMSVKVNGQTWYNLGNSGYTGGKTSNGVKAIDILCESKVLDLVSGLGLDPLADYSLQFYITGRSYSGAGWLNKSCDINKTGQGGQGARNTELIRQNYMRLIVQEMD